MLQKKLWIVLWLFIATTIFGQESYLFTNDKFSGINAAVVSPTQTLLDPNPWDINLVAVDVFLQNDYAYISKMSILGLTNSNVKAADIKNNITGENSAAVLDFYNKNFANYHFSSDLMGPAVSKISSIGNFHFALGLFSRVRTQTAGIHIDNYMKFNNQDILEPETYQLEPVKINFMNWAETGLNFATNIFSNPDYQLIIGANLKYELGMDGLVVSSAPMALQRTDTTTEGLAKQILSAHHFDVSASYATSYDAGSKKYRLKPQGKGLGLDLGVTFISKNVDDDYNSKISLNILDVGKVDFIGENHRFIGDSLQLTGNAAFENKKFDSPQKILQTLSKEVYGNETASFKGSNFTIGLPTSLHLNISKNLGAFQFLNMDVIQRIPVFENSLKRSNILNVSYSVQKQAIGYGVSTSLYEYRNLQFGGYIRLGPLILGSENALPFLFKHQKLHASDFYIALKLYPFWDNEVKRHRRKKCYCD